MVRVTRREISSSFDRHREGRAYPKRGNVTLGTCAESDFEACARLKRPFVIRTIFEFGRMLVSMSLTIDLFFKKYLYAISSPRSLSPMSSQKFLATGNVSVGRNNSQVDNENRNAYVGAIKGTFNPLFKVLSTFPLRYLYAIGIGKLMSLAHSLLCNS